MNEMEEMAPIPVLQPKKGQHIPKQLRAIMVCKEYWDQALRCGVIVVSEFINV